MPTTIGVIGSLVGISGAAATVSTAALIGAAIEVGGVVASLAYQRKQQKKAKAAAERLRKQQQAAQKAYNSKLSKLKLGGFEGGSFSTAAGPRDITEMVRKSTASRRIVYGRARLGGIWFYPETTGDSNQVLHLVLGLCEGPIDAIEKVYFDDEEVPLDGSGNATGKWAGYVVIKKHLGEVDQVADSTLTGLSSNWTSDHKLTGIAYLYVRLGINGGLFSAIPEISAVVRGKADIYDPRTDTSGYSTNPALCLADYLTTPLVGPGIAWDDIDEAGLMHAADVCDEVVTTLTGTEPRYACQGAIDLGSTVEDNASLFLQAMNGDLIMEGGSFSIQAGEYQVPTFDIDEHMLSGGIEMSFLQPRKERANVVKGTFLSEANQWQRFDFPSITDAAAVAQDGQEVVTDLGLELVGSGTQAQRLANMELRQSRRGRTVQLECNLKALPARVGSNVTLTMARYFDGSVFRVVEAKFTVGNDAAPGVLLTLLENDPDIYEWDGSLEQTLNVPPALNASSPQVAAPVLSTITPPDTVTITSLTAGAVIRWSKSAAPETAADGTAYSGGVAIDPGDLLYVRAFKTGYLASALTIGNYL